MRKNHILRNAGVLLFAILMITSTIAVANTAEKKQTLYTTHAGENSQASTQAAVVWDNGMGYKVGMLAAQLYPGDIDAFPADDFQFDATYEVNAVLWQGGYYNCQYAAGGQDYHFPWNITFFTHNVTGNKPGAVYKTYSFTDNSITRQFWYSVNMSKYWIANYSVTLSPAIKFQPDTKYWVSIYAYNATFPQSGWCRHNQSVGGIKLHEGMFKSTGFGFKDWTNTSYSGLLGKPHDFNYQLGGAKIAAPILTIEQFKGGLGVSAVITNTGDAAATNIHWKISLDGKMIFLGKNTNGTIATLAAGANQKIKTGLVFGFGKINITATATCAEGSSYEEDGLGTMILFFVVKVSEPLP
jgi:hypothetical protein